jgi:hypothetical protein
LEVGFLGRGAGDVVGAGEPAAEVYIGTAGATEGAIVRMRGAVAGGAGC